MTREAPVSTLRRLWRVPVLQSSYALMATTGLNAVLGLAFWVAAARLYPADVVGLGAGGISAMQLVALAGWVGIQYLLLRYVPVAGHRRVRLIVTAYAASGIAALLVAVAFLALLAARFDVGFVQEDLASAIAFVAAVAVWVVFSLQDSVLIALRRSLLVPIENAAYGGLKLVILVSLVSLDSPWALFAAWVVPAAGLALVVNGLLFRRFLPEAQTDGAVLPPARTLTRFALGQHGVAVMGAVPDYLVPLLIIAFLGEADNAYYYAAWTVGFSARLLAVNMTNALTVEGAYARDALRRLTRTVGGLGIAVLLPVIVVLIVGAEPLLGMFGPRYGEEAATVLRCFAIALVPFTLVSFVIAIERVQERFTSALLIVGAGTLTTLALDVAFLDDVGLEMAGIAWLCGQLVSAAFAIAGPLRHARSLSRRNTSVLAEPPGAVG